MIDVEIVHAVTVLGDHYLKAIGKPDEIYYDIRCIESHVKNLHITGKQINQVSLLKVQDRFPKLKHAFDYAFIYHPVERHYGDLIRCYCLLEHLNDNLLLSFSRN